jgi:hypothetical protein
MSNDLSPPEHESIELLDLDEVTGGCGRCGCGGIGGVAYTRHTGFGIDPLFMFFALALYTQSTNK